MNQMDYEVQPRCQCEVQPQCRCDCGTRISLDEQLLEQRQMWKEKYATLQRQMAKDVGQIKETIYSQCSNLMQQEFQNKEKQHTKLLNKKNSDIQDLTSKIISLQTKLKVISRQKQILKQKYEELEDEQKDKDKLLTLLKSQDVKNESNWNEKLEGDMSAFRKKLQASNRDAMDKLQLQNSNLKSKNKDLQKKYQVLLPEVERLKSALNQKSSVLEDLQNRHQKMKRNLQNELSQCQFEKDELEQVHSKCKEQQLKLNQKLIQQQIIIKTQKKAKTDVKIQPIYIQKPVPVQKIVEKIVTVEKVVKQYIEPEQFRDEVLQEEFKKLRSQYDKLKSQNSVLEKRLKGTVQDYENLIKEYENNISQYKAEREKLAKKIQELNKQLDIVYTVKQASTRCSHTEPESVKVYLQNNGESEYYATTTNVNTVPRVATLYSPRSNNNIRATNDRSASRNKSLSNSNSNSNSQRKVIWK